MTNLMILTYTRMMRTRLFCEHGVPSWRFVFIVMLLFSVMTMHTNLFFAHKDTFWRFFSMEDVLYGCLDDHITYIFLFTSNQSTLWKNGSLNDFTDFFVYSRSISYEKWHWDICASLFFIWRPHSGRVWNYNQSIFHFQLHLEFELLIGNFVDKFPVSF